jgi:hypothetical protein
MLGSLSNLDSNIGRKIFGVEKQEHGKQQQTKTNRREARIREYRNELRHFNKQFKRTTEVEKFGIAVLTYNVRSELARLRRKDQRLRKAKSTRTRTRGRFVKEPFKFTTKLRGEERSGT